MRYGNFTVQMVIDGTPTREFDHNGKHYVLAREGCAFTLRVANYTSNRVEVLASIDGLSVMNGKLAGDSNPVGGYILESYQTFDIPGYRLNDREVAKFCLGGVGESYARQMDAPTDVGVIGVRIYKGKPKPPTAPIPTPAVRRRPPPTPTPACARRQTPTRSQPQNLGTGFGERAEHQVVPVNNFDRGELVAQLTFDYNTVKGFEAAGIVVPFQASKDKDPFPADAQGCPPPRGWQG